MYSRSWTLPFSVTNEIRGLGQCKSFYPRLTRVLGTPEAQGKRLWSARPINVLASSSVQRRERRGRSIRQRTMRTIADCNGHGTSSASAACRPATVNHSTFKHSSRNLPLKLST